MGGLEAAIAQRGGALIFLNVLLQQIGVPIPAEPTLLVAGSLSARGHLSAASIAGAILVATLIADVTWFFIGRRFGEGALRVVLRVSSSPQRRLQQLEHLFSRRRTTAITLGKLFPGFPMAAPVLAGALGAPLRVFLAYDLLALTLWGATFTGLGAIFQGNVAFVVRSLERVGAWGLVLAGGVVASLVARSVARYVRAARAAREPAP